MKKINERKTRETEKWKTVNFCCYYASGNINNMPTGVSTACVGLGSSSQVTDCVTLTEGLDSVWNGSRAFVRPTPVHILCWKVPDWTQYCTFQLARSWNSMILMKPHMRIPVEDRRSTQKLKSPSSQKNKKQVYPYPWLPCLTFMYWQRTTQREICWTTQVGWWFQGTLLCACSPNSLYMCTSQLLYFWDGKWYTWKTKKLLS